MIPLNNNDPYIDSTGKRSTLGAEIAAGGGGDPYTLPTASENTKGGIKVGSGLSMVGEVLNVIAGGTPDYINDLYIIGEHEDYLYYIPMTKRYNGPGIRGYEIETNPESSSSEAKIDLYEIAYDDGSIIYKSIIKTLVHNGDNTYSDGHISISYSNTNWVTTITGDLYNESGETYTSPLTWSYNTDVDYVMLTEDPT